jgi:choloylglycine hydrolase
MISANGFEATLHLAVEDASGDSAILELADGELAVHHGREFRLMTNDPTYDEQLTLLAGRDFSHPRSDMPLPGNVNPVDRFQRAAYYSALLPEPANQRQGVASMLAIMRNVSVPFGAPYGEFGVYDTEYRTVCDLTHLVYFFELTTSPNTLWVRLSGLEFAEGAPTRVIDPYDEALAGDVTERFTTRDIGF